MTERKYPLSKIAAGDYVLPSNDGRALWRVSRYRVDDRRSVDRWLIQRWIGGGNLEAIARSDLLDWNLWETWDTEYETRAEAIDAALRAAV